MPIISVIMPVYNGRENGHEAYLRPAIESILNQTLGDLELLVLDEGSTDGTADVVKEYAGQDARVRLLAHPTRRGLPAALNRGILEARGELIARQDADDMSVVTRLELQREFLEKRPATAMCGTGMYRITPDGKLVGELQHPTSYEEIRRTLLTGCRFVHGTVMFRKEAVQAVGLYSTSPDFEHCEDYELWVRLAARFVVENIPHRSLYFHREHALRVSVVHSRQQEEATRRVMKLAQRLLA